MTGSIIFWYLIGVIVSFTGIFLYEFLYLYDRRIQYITKREIVEDCLLSLLSWVMVLWLLISVSIDFYLKWPSKGYELNRKKAS